MQRARLTDVGVRNMRKPGMHADGGGLYLRVTAGGTRSWIFRYRSNGRLHDMGLGILADVSLAEARRKAAKLRQQRLEGTDPLSAKRQARAQAALDAAKAITFDAACDAFIRGHEDTWSSAKHKAQWRSTLETYATPVFGALPVADIDTGLVVRVLEPIWTTKPETASRLRQRIERVLDWSTVRGYREGPNPARWKGHLDQTLPAPGKVRRVVHLAAMPYAELPVFWTELCARSDISAAALRFAIPTACRTSEVLGARWSEIDQDNAVWTIPAERMKGGREHRVPLTPAALTVLREMAHVRRGEFVFTGIRADRPLSNMAMSMLLRRMGHDDVTVHGFRSSFRDWAAERTNHDSHVVEMALAHAIPSAVEAAYRRGDLFEKRRRLMADWARYVTTPESERGRVVPLHSAVS